MRVGTQCLPLLEERELPVLDYIDFRREADCPVLHCRRLPGRNVARPLSPRGAIMCVLTSHEKRKVIQPGCVRAAEMFKLQALVPHRSFQEGMRSPGQDGNLVTKDDSIVDFVVDKSRMGLQVLMGENSLLNQRFETDQQGIAGACRKALKGRVA